MDYSKLSEQEINFAVAKCFPERFLFNEEGKPYEPIPDSMAAYSGTDFDEVEFDPCSNPADAWPIIEGNFIAVVPIMNGWCASSDEDAEIYCAHKNPLRAAAIVFLMMQEKNDAS